jgi:hypothetical protein
MGRVIMYTVIALLAVFVLLITFVVQQGGGPVAGVASVSVHDLRMDSDRYMNQLVSTEGVLVYSEEMESFGVFEEEGLYIWIRYEDEAELERLEGDRVSVAGRVEFMSGTGVFIDVDLIESAE